ncbi:group III truncated hemoglobin [Wenyingzhuangia sp. 2_MG-2023]|uniref:group III truncated hemoglobin n=1 Tax=Wenyingzhuangia sp. 2_MG-2023 TaxID=3062639 RepID=UPI0026E1D264|nr:group III truncated hemoglobin [Wenyingzhuangia sp. 2_MG-2023]MDO6738513.1 group III truncated hemoglobin [Wenyingzhuangia sp. 2_MG-2023]
MKQDIQNRADINQLVNHFYSKVRKDNLLGPIFNRMIPEKAWPVHLEKLTDFWETNLFGIPKFKGNPTQKHLLTDATFDHVINQEHFDHWLSLWKNSIDELYQGDLATRAQMAAYSIAQIQNMVIARNKPIATEKI